MGRKRSYMTSFEGIVPNLERRYQRDRLRLVAREDRGVHVGAAVPGLQGRAAAAGVAGGHGRRHGDPRVHRAERERALEWFEPLELTETDRAIARLILREIEERLRFLDNVGVGYLSMERASATL